MTILHPLIDGNFTFLCYTDYESEVCLFQWFNDQSQVELLAVQEN